MPTYYVVRAGDWRCFARFRWNIRGKNSLGETRRLDGHKEPSAPQNAPNIVKHTASHS
jgi:hypothetical protein